MNSRAVATRERATPLVGSTYLPTGRSTAPDTHELESRIRIRWHKPMRAASSLRLFAERPSNPPLDPGPWTARDGSPRNVTCLRVLSILTHYSPLVRSSMWAYRLPHSVSYARKLKRIARRTAPYRTAMTEKDIVFRRARVDSEFLVGAGKRIVRN